MKNPFIFSFSFLFLTVLLLFPITNVWAQCYLSADMMMDGSLFRKSSQVVYDQAGSELRFETVRLGDDYSLRVKYIQSTTEGGAVNIISDGYNHPLEFKLLSGSVLKLLPQKDELVRSVMEQGVVSYENTYELSKEQAKKLALYQLSDVTIRCFGTEVKRGAQKDNIEISIGQQWANLFSKDMACMVRDEPKPSEVATASPNKDDNRKSVEVVKAREESAPAKNVVAKPSLSTTDSLLVEILTRMDASKEAKPEKEFVPRVFGFGVYFKTNYTFSSISAATTDLDLVINKFMSGASINVSFNAAMKKKVGFRFEPFVDFLVTNTNNQFGGTSNIQSQIGFFETGMRLLLMIRRNRVNIYPGVSGSYVNLSGKKSTNGTGVKATRSGGSVGLILGGEYLLTPNIGIRLESGFMYYGLGKITSNNALFTNKSQNIFGSFARLGGSFYF